MQQLAIKLPLDLMQTRWASALNPLLSLPIVAGNQINNILLPTGTPVVINHLLSRMPQGWIITDVDNNTSIYRTAPFNNKTLTLEATSRATISLWVY